VFILVKKESRVIMLMNIIRMPPVFGIPTDRCLNVHMGANNSRLHTNTDAYWPKLPLSQESFSVGARIDKQPSHLYKTIHISQDGQYIFETVFSVEPFGHTCLYTKIISVFETVIGVSLKTIAYYQSTPIQLIPTAYFIAPPAQAAITDNIVPVVLGEPSLWRYANRLVDLKSTKGLDARLGWMYKPLYDHIPGVFDALTHGSYARSPFAEIPGFHPSVNIQLDKWFSHEELAYSVEAMGYQDYLNHRAFDAIVLGIITTGPAKFTITTLISHALDGVSDLWLTKDYKDPYQAVLRGMMQSNTWYVKHLSDIFYQCIQTYCRLYEIYPDVFYKGDARGLTEQSSITITKNIHDEVVITFHDLIHDRYVCFYSSFPVLALTTLAVGHL
jgi:hypothetical protein